MIYSLLLKKIALGFPLFLASYGSTPSPLLSDAMKATNKTENQTINKQVMNDEMKKATSAAAANKSTISSPDMMIVDAKQVAQDWKQAFENLKKKQLPKLVFTLVSNEKITNIVNIEPIDRGLSNDIHTKKFTWNTL